MSVGAYILAGLGRILLSLIFIVLGVSAIFHWETSEATLASVLSNWELYTGNMEEAGNLFPFLLSSIRVWMVLGVSLQLLGGFLVFCSIRVRLGAFLLLAYLVPATILYHHFWFLDGQALQRSLVLFLKNFSIIGGLAVVLGMGKGVVGDGGASKSGKAADSKTSKR